MKNVISKLTKLIESALGPIQNAIRAASSKAELLGNSQKRMLQLSLRLSSLHWHSLD